MGIEAVRLQSKSQVIIIGINNLGLEIAKNIVLSGIKKLVLSDWKTLQEDELLG